MNNRERFRAAMAFEPLDRPCHIEHGFWPETYDAWRLQGLPSNVTAPVLEYLGPKPDLFEYFDVTRYAYILRGQYFAPPEQPTVLEETEEYTIQRDELGRIVKTSKTSISLPQHMEFPVTSLMDYHELRERLTQGKAIRYPENWPELAKQMHDQQDALVCTHMDGFFAFPRELMGVERAITLFYDDPQLARELITDRVNFYIELYEDAIKSVQPDFAFIWEDMCFNYGPLVSPAIFKEFMAPAYRKLTAFLRSVGINTIIVDSDGDVSLLIPHWLESGITGLLPFEVKAGMDIVHLGRQYPNLQIIGGIDKHALEKTTGHIDAELSRVMPAMMERGGYAVALDHWVHPDIPLENYRYFAEKVHAWKSSEVCAIR